MITCMKSESGIQFDDIYEEHHNPETIDKKKIDKNRKKRKEEIKKDLGL